MAAAGIPAKLKTLDITRFVHRASQLEKFKPAISYWCNYYVLQQILAKGMQSADAECTTWTVALMDHVEQIKTEHGVEDAIADDGAAQAYVEQFGLQTFQRADNAITANKVSKQTADTLQAAATFLELLSIWNPPTPDIASKIKYAKFHALRIAKAIRAGEDPNTTNPPPPSESAPDEVPALDPNDPDVLQINRAAALQPSVEDVPDVSPVDAADAATAAATAPSPAPVVSPETAPLADAASTEQPRQGSAGGGYFPQVTPAPAEQPPQDAESFYGGSAAPMPPPAAAAPPVPTQSPPTQIPTRSAGPAPVPAPAPIPAPVSAPIPAPAPAPSPAPAPAWVPSAGAPDDAAVAEAQKHARWAISALNFEDVSTAVKELRLALGNLGAT